MTHCFSLQEAQHSLLCRLVLAFLELATDVVMEVLGADLIEQRELLFEVIGVTTNHTRHRRFAFRAGGQLDGGAVFRLDTHPVIHGFDGNDMMAIRKLDVACCFVVVFDGTSAAVRLEDFSVRLANTT